MELDWRQGCTEDIRFAATPYCKTSCSEHTVSVPGSEAVVVQGMLEKTEDEPIDRPPRGPNSLAIETGVLRMKRRSPVSLIPNFGR